jgi:hypothetical protein
MEMQVIATHRIDVFGMGFVVLSDRILNPESI